jgi:hypothetical protein
MVWCDEACVIEHVALERGSLRWVLRRYFRIGNTHSGFDRDLHGTWSRTALRVAKAGGWMGTGVLRATVGALAFRVPLVVDGLSRLWRGAGMLAGVFGYQYIEYRRSQS